MLNACVWRRFVKQQQGTCCRHWQGCRRPPPPGWAGTRAPLAWAFQRLRPQCCPRPTCSKLIVALAGCQSSAQAPQLMYEVQDFWSMAGSKFQVGMFVSVLFRFGIQRAVLGELSAACSPKQRPKTSVRCCCAMTR